MVSIGPAQEPDFDWCARLMAESEPWRTLRLDLERCRQSLRRPGGELFVAHEGGRRAGFILIDPDGLAGSPYIAAVAVAPSDRNQGIGQQLLTFAEKRAAGRRFIFLCVSSFNLRAQQFYDRLGYQRVGDIPNYIVEGHSELLLCKRLS
jgi:[ribosomal protein S18]-alanine N-acetyltransferase